MNSDNYKGNKLQESKDNLKYYYIVNEVTYNTNDNTTSIDIYFKKCKDNILLTTFLILLKIYLMKFHTFKSERKDSVILEGIDEYMKELIEKIDGLNKKLREIEEKKSQITDPKQLESLEMEIEKITNEKKKYDVPDYGILFQIKIEEFLEEFSSGTQLVEIRKFLEGEIDEDDPFGNIAKYLEKLEKDTTGRQERLEIFFIDKIIEYIKMFGSQRADKKEMVKRILSFTFEKPTKFYEDVLKVEFEQLNIIGIPGTKKDNDGICSDGKVYKDQTFCNDTIAEKCWNHRKSDTHFFYHIALFENNYTDMSDLIISLFVNDLNKGLINFYICKSIQYSLKKWLHGERELGNAAMIIHSFSLHRFNKKYICTNPIPSMQAIFEKKEHNLKILSSDDEFKKYNLTNPIDDLSAQQDDFLYNKDDMSSLCKVLQPYKCIVPDENSKFFEYWKINKENYDIEENMEYTILKKKDISKDKKGGYYYMYIDNKHLYAKLT